jgi:hypothetical protein
VTLHSKILGGHLSESRSQEVSFWFSIRLHREKATGRGDEKNKVSKCEMILPSTCDGFMTRNAVVSSAVERETGLSADQRGDSFPNPALAAVSVTVLVPHH